MTEQRMGRFWLPEAVVADDASLLAALDGVAVVYAAPESRGCKKPPGYEFGTVYYGRHHSFDLVKTDIGSELPEYRAVISGGRRHFEPVCPVPAGAR